MDRMVYSLFLSPSSMNRSAGPFLAKKCCLLDVAMQNVTSSNAGVKDRFLASWK